MMSGRHLKSSNTEDVSLVVRKWDRSLQCNYSRKKNVLWGCIWSSHNRSGRKCVFSVALIVLTMILYSFLGISISGRLQIGNMVRKAVNTNKGLKDWKEKLVVNRAVNHI
ncbi:hypothetical protein KIL84_019339 [Mauremys mutica]|uniref:Transmembrane protein n=1 Tax=Mauremys mutica TaxID=74926 RepID=A0A9D3XWL0_9SAUR|nr:hypothetical protein KIL84_019339 [Mauremys mutica]